MPTPTTLTKPKLIPLKELRALCKEAGLEVSVGPRRWSIWRNGTPVGEAYVSGALKYHCRQNLKAFATGLIAMCKRGEL